MFIICYFLFIMKYIEFIIYDLLLQCLNVGWMKDTLVCGNCLSPTLLINEEGDSHLSLYLPRRSIKLNKDRTFLHGPFAWYESDITPTHARNISKLKRGAKNSHMKLFHVMGHMSKRTTFLVVQVGYVTS